MCRRLAISFGLCLIALGLSGCFGSNATGRYIAKFSNGVYRLQLVQAQDGHLSGQLDTVTLSSEGKIEYSSFIASGVSDDSSISLTFKQSAFLSSTLAGSGTITGNRITLTGDVNPGRLSSVVFIRGTEADYQVSTNELIQQANNIVVGKANAEAAKRELVSQQGFANELNELVDRIQRFGTEADIHLARWPGAQANYRAITDKMNLYLRKERTLVGIDAASVERGQISVAISQGSIGTDQLRNSAISLQNEFKFNVGPLMESMDIHLLKCRNLGTFAAYRSVTSACDKLGKESQSFRQKYNLVAQGLIGLENAYQEEHKKQEKIVQISEQLE
jgi:hypothetical protein